MTKNKACVLAAVLALIGVLCIMFSEAPVLFFVGGMCAGAALVIQLVYLR